MSLVMSPDDVLQAGLEAVGTKKLVKMKLSVKASRFKLLYGSSHLLLSDMWDDLRTNGLLVANEDNEKGFRSFLVAMHFLWVCPRNSTVLGSQFGLAGRTVESDRLWPWIEKVSQLYDTAVTWEADENDDPNIFVYSVDCIDFICWEKPHERYRTDKRMCSSKYKTCALRYEIALSIWENRVLWTNGPFKPGVTDNRIWRNGLKQKVLEISNNQVGACLGIGDKGYRSTDPDDRTMLATPNETDPPELKKFKSRCRCRQEQFNSNMKKFEILYQPFRFSVQKHQHAFRAVCTIMQYRMEHDEILFDSY